MASRNSKKSSGLRFLWIPGGRKSHSKGRYSSTNKQLSYTTRQKNNQVWSLGGSKAQQNLLEADPSTPLLDGPSTSSLVRATAASGATAAAAAASSIQCSESHNFSNVTNENCTVHNKEQQQNLPTTPNSSTSTAPLTSPPQSPLEQNAQLSDNSTQPSTTSSISNTTTATTTMPAKYHQRMPVLVTATTTADIMEENRFSLLSSKDNGTNKFDIYSLPSPPTANLNSQEHLNNSSGTTISQITPSDSPHKTNNESQNGSVNSSPVKKKQQRNNNQGDVNSIESITEDSEKIPSGNLDWIDDMVQHEEDRVSLTKPQEKKKKKKYAKGLDQLDGVPMKENSTDESLKEEDEKTVKCLYYTLMCCDCTIS